MGVAASAKRSLYEFDWQILRVNLSFASLIQAKTSIDECLAYYEGKECSTRALYKVVNLLAATTMGLNGQLKQALKSTNLARIDELVQIRDYVTEQRTILSEVYATRPKQKEDFEVDNTIRTAELVQANTEDIEQVLDNLEKRLKGAKKRPYEVRRNELTEYIDLLKHELHCRATATRR